MYNADGLEVWGACCVEHRTDAGPEQTEGAGQTIPAYEAEINVCSRKGNISSLFLALGVWFWRTYYVVEKAVCNSGG